MFVAINRTLQKFFRLITLPEHQATFDQEVRLATEWYNKHHPHETLDGRTPNRICLSRQPAIENPPIEPGQRWPRASTCAIPQVGVNGEPGDPVLFEIDCHKGRRDLPIIRVRPAA